MIPVADVLALEAKHPQMTEVKRTAIAKLAAGHPVHYHLRLVRILADEQLLTEALRTDPTTTNRLLRLRDERAKARKAVNRP